MKNERLFSGSDRLTLCDDDIASLQVHISAALDGMKHRQMKVNTRVRNSRFVYSSIRTQMKVLCSQSRLNIDMSETAEVLPLSSVSLLLLGFNSSNERLSSNGITRFASSTAALDTRLTSTHQATWIKNLFLDDKVFPKLVLNISVWRMEINRACCHCTSSVDYKEALLLAGAQAIFFDSRAYFFKLPQK